MEAKKVAFAAIQLAELPEDPPLHIRCIHTIEVRGGVIVGGEPWLGGPAGAALSLSRAELLHEVVNGERPGTL